jgi:ABC-type polar amino acid transport system ATPase subunit
MIKRDAAEKLKKLAEGFPAVSVIGPRQSGKTTLVRSVFPINRMSSKKIPIPVPLLRRIRGVFWHNLRRAVRLLMKYREFLKFFPISRVFWTGTTSRDNLS